PAPLPCQWQPLRDGATTIGSARMTHFPLQHPGGCVGYRLDWPQRSLAYVTATTASPAAASVKHIQRVDLLLTECNFHDEQREWAEKTGHSFTTAVAQVAAKAGAKRLVLTHFDPLNDADDPIDLAVARRVFPATELGADHMAIEF